MATDPVCGMQVDEKRAESDGTEATTGVAWKMGEQDKDDLIAFLKTL